MSELPQIPSGIGDYTVVRHIATGGMGVVFEGRHVETEKRVAIKLLRRDRRTIETLLRFDQEGNILRDFTHPGIATVLGTGTHNAPSADLPYLIMDFVDGQPITEHAIAKSLNDDARLCLILDLCDALQYAHERGVLHRDIKPANVLVTDAGVLQLVDFGIARPTGSDALRRQWETVPGSMMGTMPYMSPEQARGGALPVDERGDLYGVAAITYELLAGVPPHQLEGVPFHEALETMRSSEPPRLDTHRPGLPEALCDLLAAALKPARHHRPQSVAAFAAALRPLLPSSEST